MIGVDYLDEDDQAELMALVDELGDDLDEDELQDLVESIYEDDGGDFD